MRLAERDAVFRLQVLKRDELRKLHGETLRVAGLAKRACVLAWGDPGYIPELPGRFDAVDTGALPAIVLFALLSDPTARRAALLISETESSTWLGFGNSPQMNAQAFRRPLSPRGTTVPSVQLEL